MSGSALPVVMTIAGLEPQDPASLRAQLVAAVTATNPGYTANLPGSLIEDVASTSVGAVVLCDQARVDAVNSVTPYGANPFVLNQLGQQFGIQQGVASNSSVYVVFSGSVGYVIPIGFVVGDGTYQYVVQNGGIIGTSGSTGQLFAVAIQPGSWAIPASSVTQIITSVPSQYSVTVTNPEAGTPGGSAETLDDYRARVLEAGRVAATGTPAYLKTLLRAIPGVNPLLVSVRTVSGGYEVICGGGDAYAVAAAIYQAVPDLSTLQGSTTTSRNVVVTVSDPPDTYTITFVNPPQQTVTIAVTWNTQQTNFTAAATVAQLGAPAVQDYINGIYVGQPINLLEVQAAFQQAVAPILATNLLTTLTFSVTINGTAATPTAGTSVIESDPESYFYCSASGVTVTQG